MEDMQEKVASFGKEAEDVDEDGDEDGGAMMVVEDEEDAEEPEAAAEAVAADAGVGETLWLLLHLLVVTVTM
jgi:hypothetical protein